MGCDLFDNARKNRNLFLVKPLEIINLLVIFRFNLCYGCPFRSLEHLG